MSHLVFDPQSVYLALLCKAADIKRFGYSEVLKALLEDIDTKNSPFDSSLKVPV